MTTRRPGLLAGAWQVARRRAHRAAIQPWTLPFIPLILLQTIGTSLVAVGSLDTPFLVTPGIFVVGAMGTLMTCVCLLLLFYAVESLERERSTRLAAIAYATPIRTGSLLLGKSVALATVALTIAAATPWAGSSFS